MKRALALQAKVSKLSGHKPTLYKCHRGCITEYKNLIRIPVTLKNSRVCCPHCNSDKLTKL
jgi:hypothetical protein